MPVHVSCPNDENNYGWLTLGTYILHIILFNPHNNLWEQPGLISLLQERKLRLREIKSAAPDPAAGKCQNAAPSDSMVLTSVALKQAYV